MKKNVIYIYMYINGGNSFDKSQKLNIFFLISNCVNSCINVFLFALNISVISCIFINYSLNINMTFFTYLYY